MINIFKAFISHGYLVTLDIDMTLYVDVYWIYIVGYDEAGGEVGGRAAIVQELACGAEAGTTLEVSTFLRGAVGTSVGANTRLDVSAQLRCG